MEPSISQDIQYISSRSKLSKSGINDVSCFERKKNEERRMNKARTQNTVQSQFNLCVARDWGWRKLYDFHLNKQNDFVLLFSHFVVVVFGNVSLRVSVLSCELFSFFGIRSASQPFHADKIYGKAFCIMISFVHSLCVLTVCMCVFCRRYQKFLFPLDAMTVNHHGKYFIIRNDLRRGQNGMNEK